MYHATGHSAEQAQRERETPQTIERAAVSAVAAFDRLTEADDMNDWRALFRAMMALKAAVESEAGGVAP